MPKRKVVVGGLDEVDVVPSTPLATARASQFCGRRVTTGRRPLAIAMQAMDEPPKAQA
jgi:hypothetical protein